MAETLAERALTEVATMPRNDSSVWDWPAGSAPPSQGASLHNGNVFAPDKQASPPVSQGNSKHKGTQFGPDGQLLVSSMKKSPSTLWFWETKESSLPSSRNNSVRKGTAFSESVFGEHQKRPSRNNSLRGGNAFAGGIAEETTAPTNAPMKRNSSFSFLWNWGKYRRDGEDAPGKEAESEDSVAASRISDARFAAALKTSDPAVMPPKGMMKNRSIGEPNGPPKSRLSRLAHCTRTHSRAQVIMTLTHPFSRRLHSSCILQARTCGAGMRCAPRHLARQVRLGTQARNSSSTMNDWHRCGSITSRNRNTENANSIRFPARFVNEHANARRVSSPRLFFFTPHVFSAPFTSLLLAKHLQEIFHVCRVNIHRSADAFFRGVARGARPPRSIYRNEWRRCALTE